ncbi:MAG: YfcL family protein [Aestuariibacter sp.]
MTSTNHNSAGLIAQADHIQQFIESMVENGNDQELFISAYVNGHFDLAVARCLESPGASLSTLDQHMRNSLESAKKELDGDDFEQALRFWQSCYQYVCI